MQRLRRLVADHENVHFYVCQLDPERLSEHRELWGRDPSVTLDAFVAAIGLGYPGARVERWDLLARTQAQRLLSAVLQREQAYDAPRLELALAERIASAFVELFEEQARFFTNGTVEETPLGLRTNAWYGSVTLATFETGVIAVDERRIGLLYLADED
ncbi:hypothetical protein [Sorangium sp. So ce145]|uniref:hypothetical protein n=1 Tax=Sorangium sp. So ce145 TaxID=3133285 RepID=UPI003F628F62